MSVATRIERPNLELGPLANNWGFLLAAGVCLILVGLAAIGSSLVATLATVVVFGIQLLVGGILQFVASFWARGWKGFSLHLLAGIVCLIGGVFLIDHPVAGALGLTLLIAAGLLVSGLLRVTLALTERFEGWDLMLLSGAVSLLLGLAIWRQWPLSGLWAIGLFVGIEFLFSGLSWVRLALIVRAVRPPLSLSPAGGRP